MIYLGILLASIVLVLWLSDETKVSVKFFEIMFLWVVVVLLMFPLLYVHSIDGVKFKDEDLPDNRVYKGPVSDHKMPKEIIKIKGNYYYESKKTQELKRIDKTDFKPGKTLHGKPLVRVGMYSIRKESFYVDFVKNPWTGIVFNFSKPKIMIDKVVEKVDSENSNFEIQNHTK